MTEHDWFDHPGGRRRCRSCMGVYERIAGTECTGEGWVSAPTAEHELEANMNKRALIRTATVVGEPYGVMWSSEPSEGIVREFSPSGLWVSVEWTETRLRRWFKPEHVEIVEVLSEGRVHGRA